MAFTNIPNARNTGFGGRGAITNKVRLGKLSTNGTAQMLIASDVAAAAGITSGHHVAVMVGTGDDAGRVLISPAAGGFKVLRGKPKNASPTLNLPKRIFKNAPTVAMTVRHEVTPDGLIVHLGRLITGDEQPANGVAPTYEARAA